jgi:hypothetical protein
MSLGAARQVSRVVDSFVLLLAAALGRLIPADFPSQEGMSIIHGAKNYGDYPTLLDVCIHARSLELLFRLIVPYLDVPQAVRDVAAGPPALVTSEEEALGAGAAWSILQTLAVQSALPVTSQPML